MRRGLTIGADHGCAAAGSPVRSDDARGAGGGWNPVSRRAGERIHDELERRYGIDNGSSHPGQASIARMHDAHAHARLIHLPIHASWLNQLEL